MYTVWRNCSMKIDENTQLLCNNILTWLISLGEHTICFGLCTKIVTICHWTSGITRLHLEVIGYAVINAWYTCAVSRMVSSWNIRGNPAIVLLVLALLFATWRVSFRPITSWPRCEITSFSKTSPVDQYVECYTLVVVREGTKLVEQWQGLTSAARCGDVTARALRNVHRRENLKQNMDNIIH